MSSPYQHYLKYTIVKNQTKTGLSRCCSMNGNCWKIEQYLSSTKGRFLKICLVLSSTRHWSMMVMRVKVSAWADLADLTLTLMVVRQCLWANLSMLRGGGLSLAALVSSLFAPLICIPYWYFQPAPGYSELFSSMNSSTSLGTWLKDWTPSLSAFHCTPFF